MADEFETYRPALNSPAGKQAAVTPNDDNDLPATSRGLWVGGAGDVAVILADDPADATGETYNAVPAASILPLRARRVLATGTTATNIIAMS